jgi:hypothetical protein
MHHRSPHLHILESHSGQSSSRSNLFRVVRMMRIFVIRTGRKMVGPWSAVGTSCRYRKTTRRGGSLASELFASRRVGMQGTLLLVWIRDIPPPSSNAGSLQRPSLVEFPRPFFQDSAQFCHEFIVSTSLIFESDRR